jgi:benzoyl-CoA reductase/2-hydroxyglutaryl-CoA dehydratase subunit BcrC/BadD/HgdB
VRKLNTPLTGCGKIVDRIGVGAGETRDGAGAVCARREGTVEARPESQALQEFAEAAQTLSNPALRRWKEEGKKVVGYFCSYGPQELITAAGFLPFRMRGTGSTGTELADAYLTSVNCSFIRHCLNLGLQGEYDFLDGLVVLSSCDNIRRVYDNWKRKVDTPFVHMISLPKTTGER